MDSIAWK